MTQKIRRCPICGHSPLKPTLVERTFEFGTEEQEPVTIHAHDVPIEVCDNCGESYSGPETARAEHEAICRELGLPTPAEIVSLRERLHLSQDKFAELTGINQGTLSNWECGRSLPNRAMARYLQLLDALPETIQVLTKTSAQLRTDPFAHSTASSTTP